MDRSTGIFKMKNKSASYKMMSYNSGGSTLLFFSNTKKFQSIGYPLDLFSKFEFIRHLIDYCV